MKNKALLILSTLLMTVISSCQTSSSGQQKTNEATSSAAPFEFDLSQPIKLTLSSILDEISGITFHPDNAGILYAIQDEDGKVFTYDIASEKIVDEFSFGKNGDYEDIATDGKYIYVLRSDGDIYYFPFAHNNDKSLVKIIKNVLPKGEYESLAYNSKENTLIALCKECKVDKSASTLTGYTFEILGDGTLNKPTMFAVQISDLKALDNTISKTIKPSAITFNHKTNEWYIISSIDKILIATDMNFKPRFVIPIKRDQFEQPEGMAVNQNGDLYISNEISNALSSTLYKFQLKK
ncbi:SdiA-regulated domain-containing protein [Sphingobacterium bovistauri]|uniref:SdiA-regulated domain-containing protein n=1 Tax=Sphingobacterium bovistauri TaxID=2781959 RepID=A0ABS7Z467_9SPHI|nr:SdiA-regulated domain-containing protein [Sphingobacterium bovistauri]MCA5004942.1 SdiA-regulated domain-containing protein [Sphingobacterium bovistauri]